MGVLPGVGWRSARPATASNHLPKGGPRPSCMPMSKPGSDAQRMEKIVSLCKRRGFIFQSSEIYGGLNGAWDYGPLGVELKGHLQNSWWRKIVHQRDAVVGMDGSLFTHPSGL